MSAPKVSIVTPSYNQGEFIEDTLSSVARQEYDAIEHIVVDGGSEDGTLGLLKQWESRYDLRWESKPDDGHAYAVNRGFRLADGEVVGWLNSDDYYLYRDTVQKAVNQLYEDDADLVYGHIVIVDRRNIVKRAKRVPAFNRKLLKRWCYVHQPSVFMRRHVVDDELLDEGLSYSLDYEYWLRVSKRYKVRRIDEVLAVDRNHRHRKIINDVEKADREVSLVRKKFEYPLNWLDPLIRKFAIMLWSRLGGTKYVVEVCRDSCDGKTMNILCPRSLKLVSNQLVGKQVTGWGDFTGCLD